MAGPYQRITHGDRANDGGVTDATVVINAMQAGLESVEADISAMPFTSAGRIKNVLHHNIKNDAFPLKLNLDPGTTDIATCTSSGLGTASVFTPAHVGRSLAIDHDNTATKSWTYATITEYVSPTQVRITRTGGGFLVAATGASAVCGTNNATAINTLIGSLAPYDLVYWPTGRYLTFGTHTINVDKITMLGDGMHHSIIMATQMSNPLFKVTSSLTTYKGLHFQHVSCETTGYTVEKPVFPTFPSLGSTGLLVEYPDPYGWSGTNVFDCMSSGFYDGFRATQGIGFNIKGGGAGSFVRAGAHLANYGLPDSGSHHLWNMDFYSDPTFSGGAYAGIMFESGGGAEFSNNHFFMGYMGIACVMTGNPITNLRVIGNSFEDFNADYGGVAIDEGEALSQFGTGVGIGVTANYASLLHGIVINSNIVNSVLGGLPISLKGLGTGGSAGVLKSGTITGNSSTRDVPVVSYSGVNVTKWAFTGNSSNATNTDARI